MALPPLPLDGLLTGGVRRMARNSLAVLSGGVAVRGSAFLAFLLLARGLPPAQLGVFALVVATVEVVRQLTELGLTTATVRRLSALPAEAWPATVAAGLALRLLGAVAGFLALAALSLLPALAPERPLFLIGGALLFTGAVAAGLTAPFQASLEMGRLWRVHLFAGVVYLAAVAWGVRAGWSVAAFLAAYAGQELVAALGIAARFFRRHRLEGGGLHAESLVLARSAVWIGLLTTLVLLYFRLDVFMLEALRGSEAVGQYALAFRVSEALLLVATALSASTFPRLAALAASAPSPAVEHAFGRLYRGACLVGTGLALAASLAAPPLLGLVSPAYAEGARLAGVLVWSVAFMFVNIQTADLLIATGRTRVVAGIALGNLSLNAMANFLLIPPLGALGAVLATVLTEGVNFVVQGWYVSRRVGIPLPARAALAVGVAAAAGVAWHLVAP